LTPVEPPLWMHVQAFNPATNTLVLGQIIEADKTVWIDTTKLADSVHEFEKPGVPIIETFTVNLARGYHVAKVQKVITTEWMLQQDNTVVPFPWITTITAEWPIYVTIKEDIRGSYYINPRLTAPDFYVDLKDTFAADLAFGSFPGHPAWNTVADINGDYNVDLKDTYKISIRFGWVA